MKLRHAAALALTGWYLMAPSARYFPPGSKDATGKPAQGWYMSGSDISDWTLLTIA